MLALLPLLFELIFVSVLSFLLLEAEREAQAIERSRNLTMETETLQRLCLEMGTAVAGYSLTKNPMSARQFSESKDKVLIQLGLLGDLVDDDNVAKSAVADISEVVQNEVAHLQILLDEIDGDTVLKPTQFESINANFVKLANQFSEMIRQQRNMLKGAPEEESRLRKIVEQWIFAGIAINIVMAFGLAAYVNLSATRRLNLVMENAERLSRAEALLPPLAGRDEIAKLDKIFRNMAEVVGEATRKERAIFENASDVICTLDEDLKFSAVNGASTPQWGYDSSELIGRRLVDIVFENPSAVVDFFKQSIACLNDRSIEIRIRTKTNTSIDTLWNIRWSDAENQFFCVARDISERNRLDQLRRDLVAMVSHDLRSPLTAIIASLEHIRSGARGAVNSPLMSDLKRIEDSSSRMVRLVNDFLDLEKLEAGKLELSCARTNLDVLVGSAVESVRSLAELNEVTIQDQDTDVDLLVDGDRIVQVLVNLLSNAIKFSPRGGLIVLSAETNDLGIEICVTDQGPGISEDKQAIIFDRYIQLDGSSSSPGTGLGLSICKYFVELHCGTIGVRSVIGQGSTFWVRLPKSVCCHFDESEAR